MQSNIAQQRLQIASQNSTIANLSEKEYNGSEAKNNNGNTCFKKQNLCVRPREGLAVFWKNMLDGKLNHQSLHSGIAPKYSIKYGLNVWIREGCWKG